MKSNAKRKIFAKAHDLQCSQKRAKAFIYNVCKFWLTVGAVNSSAKQAKHREGKWESSYWGICVDLKETIR